jgi:hypothetical protein
MSLIWEGWDTSRVTGQVKIVKREKLAKLGIEPRTPVLSGYGALTTELPSRSTGWCFLHGQATQSCHRRGADPNSDTPTRIAHPSCSWPPSPANLSPTPVRASPSVTADLHPAPGVLRSHAPTGLITCQKGKVGQAGNRTHNSVVCLCLASPPCI